MDIQFFQNGIWKKMPHDNFFINVVNKAKASLNDSLAALRDGNIVRVRDYSFRLKREDNHVLRDEANSKV